MQPEYISMCIENFIAYETEEHGCKCEGKQKQHQLRTGKS